MPITPKPRPTLQTGFAAKRGLTQANESARETCLSPFLRPRTAFAAALGLAAILCAPAQAAIVDVPDVIATASSEYSDANAATQTIDGSGLLGDLHDNNSSAETMWHSKARRRSSPFHRDTARGAVWIAYEFAGVHALHEVWIWNHNQKGQTSRGLKKVYIDYSEDGEHWQRLSVDGQDFVRIPEASGRAQTAHDLVVDFAGKHARYVVLTADREEGNHGTSFFGLSEVRFLADLPLAEADWPRFDSFGVEAMPMYLQHEGGPRRMARIHFHGGRMYRGGTLELGLSGQIEQIEIPPGPGLRMLEAALPDVPIQEDTLLTAVLKTSGKVFTTAAWVPPARPWEIHLLPHSHLDIGYTHPQPEIEEIQWGYFEQARDMAECSQDYPEGGRFIWNVEGLWSVERFLKAASEEDRLRFLDSVRKGYIALTGLNASLLSGICRPEELYEHVDGVHLLRDEYGIGIDTAMITDVPGYSWGIVPALAQSGIKYLSLGPNFMPHLPHNGDRVGLTLEAWGDKPFYWISPSGQEKILFWMSSKGYSWFHGWIAGTLGICGTEPVVEYINELSGGGYPYDMVPLRYTISGDNGPPDPELPDIVRQWNEKYAYPKMVINSTSGFMRQFEARHGGSLPERRGDLTPYWEDGTVSSARETALNRNAAERLVQAAALWAILRPQAFPAEAFAQAWDNVILFSEHTWGAHESVSRPDSEFTRETWAVKAAMAVDAEQASRELLADASGPFTGDGPVEAFHVFNTASWPRTGLVKLPAEWTLSGERVHDAAGHPVPSQRLSTGELAVLVREASPLGSTRFTLEQGAAHQVGQAKAEGLSLANGTLALRIDPESGAIASLRHSGQDSEFVDLSAGQGLNEYCYIKGADPAEAQRVQEGVRVTVKEDGPLVAALLIESGAPGCRSLEREVRLVAGLDRIDLVNTVDRHDVRTKDSVHFGFPFLVPHAEVRMDLAWGMMRPESDQLTGANKNYYSVQRWADVSNRDAGITLASVDAPLMEMGGMVAEAWHLRSDRPWIKKATPSSTLYSYVMNNYWHTNYKASQEGVTVFRYTIRPHAAFDASTAKRFGIACAQPLIAVPAQPEDAPEPSFFVPGNTAVLVTSVRPSRDGQAVIVRLFNASPEPQTCSPKWNQKKLGDPHQSSPMQETGPALPETITLVPWEILTVRASRNAG